MMISFLYSILISLIVYPFVVGWTLGGGFMKTLGLIDFSGCASIHLVSGFCSLFGAIVIKMRLGRFEPLAIKKTVGDKEVYMYHVQKDYIQRRINQIAKEIPFIKDMSMEQQV